MPAVTADPVTLARVAAPVGLKDRPVRSVTTAPQAYEGEGFPVRRAFAGVQLRDLDPFLHLDQMGEVEYAPGEPKGTSWHPHRGFETVTYMLDGAMEHQDSHGGGGLITDGATQWMTAARGILHIETPPERLVMSGGLFHGFQLWVNLPASQKMIAPAYQNLEAGDVRLLASEDGGALLRLIAGELGGVKGPGSTHTPITLVHATVLPGAELRLPWPEHLNALAYVLGRARHGRRGRPTHRVRAARGPRRGGGPDDAGGPGAGQPFAGARRPAARRPADPGAGGDVRAVRHEHPARAHAGGRGLPGGPPGRRARTVR
jgi:redox-sensitive bicupin YhaK (pirin superfamily)